MGKKKRYTLFQRLICLLMALYVINLSIDAPDRYATVTISGEQHENLFVNEMESFGELVLEQVLDLDNAVPEHEDSDEDSELTPVDPDYFFHQPFAFTLLVADWYVPSVPLPFGLTFFQTRAQEITSPPPQRA